jgi:hypothetical protein
MTPNSLKVKVGGKKDKKTVVQDIAGNYSAD